MVLAGARDARQLLDLLRRQDTELAIPAYRLSFEARRRIRHKTPASLRTLEDPWMTSRFLLIVRGASRPSRTTCWRYDSIISGEMSLSGIAPNTGTKTRSTIRR
ncbi:MAG TPA: hypothetical protein VMA83_10320 [Solirubrobacteraceae bacterium]|nr:hypothetical protein [Solirubrobacteraceae bacterium]